MGRTPGAHSLTPVRKPRARDRAWQSMRILRTFTSADLVATAEINPSNAGHYLARLAKAGYLTLVRPKANGQPGGHALYRLARDTGPHAPRLQTTGAVFDPNLRARK